MNRVCGAVLFVLMACSLGMSQSQSPASTSSSADEELRRIIVERKTAAARGDVAAWGKHVAEDSLWTSDSPQVAAKADVEKEIAGLKESKTTLDVEDLRVRLLGDTAVATYRELDRTDHNGKTILETYMKMATYVRRHSDWQLIGEAETLIPAAPEAVHVDPRVLDSYAGQFEFLPNNILTVWRDGDKLMAQSTGEEKGELLAENETTFFDKGGSWRWIFVKDGSGRVTHMIFRHHGNDVEMPKVK